MLDEFAVKSTGLGGAKTLAVGHNQKLSMPMPYEFALGMVLTWENKTSGYRALTTEFPACG